MCKKTILIVANQKTLKQRTDYMSMVRLQIGTPKGEASLSFLFGNEKVNPNSPIVIKVVFDPGIPLNDPNMLGRIKSDLRKINKGQMPIFLSKSMKDAEFGCHIIDELHDVRSCVGIAKPQTIPV
jgi:hypothetical protein